MTTDSGLLRLRAANPFAAATAVDEDELFRRIVATSVEPAARPRRRVPRPVLALAAGFVVAALLASAAFGISSWLFGDVVKAPVTASEYRRAQPLLTLPPGYTWPSLTFDQNAVMNRGAGGSFAVSIDQSAWECYWAHAVRDGDAAAARRARAALADLLAHRVVIAPGGASENWAPPASTPWPYAVYADDGGYQYKERLYAQAAAGNAAPLAASCRANGP
jgi:hypothetical protein